MAEDLMKALEDSLAAVRRDMAERLTCAVHPDRVAISADDLALRDDPDGVAMCRDCHREWLRLPAAMTDERAD